MSDGINFTYDMRKVTNQQINESDFIVNNITKSEVKEKNFSNSEYIFRRLTGFKKKGKGKLIILFSGYEDTTDEIYTIHEIRDYVKELFYKFPHMFYYLSQNDMTYKIIFLCLCDVQSYFPIDKHSIEDAIFNDCDISTVKSVFSIPDEISDLLSRKTVEYGISVGDTAEGIVALVRNIFENRNDQAIDGINSMNSSKEEMFNHVLELYEKSAYCFWQGIIESSNISVIPEFMALSFLKNNKYIINAISKIPKLVSYIFTQDKKVTNMFFIKDDAYGSICDKCGTNHIILLKNNLKDCDPKNSVLLPSLENYASLHIMPTTQKFSEQSPIPIDYKSDKWICPNCMEIHDFSHSDETGISY